MINLAGFPRYYDIKIVLSYGVGLMWLMSGGLASLLLWMGRDDEVIPFMVPQTFVITATFVIATTLFTSRYAPKNILRIRYFYALSGLAYFGIFFSCLAVSSMYFFLEPRSAWKPTLLITVIVLWLIQLNFDAARRVARKKLITKNYQEKGNCFVLKRPINEFNGDVHLTLKQHAEKNWIYVFIVCWSAYEFFTTDFKASLPLDVFKYWILTSLHLILVAYTAARLVQGFYLWFYIIWKLERKTGKKFLFPEPDQAPSN
ncbi:hypothetical protein [Limnobacter sp.]|uniref:hypothetical protein n=1 Tax=Limnobacter sp. TaxID=2003368 RepID=UPI002733D0E1|nr:hypothetical protein [Limnobacter sp.]MDP3188971.1 hypothetical protein [Limnobacter sp.]